MVLHSQRVLVEFVGGGIVVETDEVRDKVRVQALQLFVEQGWGDLDVSVRGKRE